MFADSFEIPSNDPSGSPGSGSGDLPTATTATTLPMLKRRVSFSAKNQVKDMTVESESGSDHSGEDIYYDSLSMDLNQTTRDAEGIDMELTGCDLSETTEQEEQIGHHHSTINDMHNNNEMGMSIVDINKNESTNLSLKSMDLTKPFVNSEAVDMGMTDNGEGGTPPEMANIINWANISHMSMDFGDKSEGSNESLRSELNQTTPGDKSIIFDATDMEMTNCESNEPEEENNNMTDDNKTNCAVRTLSFTRCESSELLKPTNFEVEVEEILNAKNKDTSIVSTKSRNSLNVQSINDLSPEPIETQAQTEPTETQTKPIILKIAQDTDEKIAKCETPPELRESATNNKVEKITQNLVSRSAINLPMKKVNIPIPRLGAFFPRPYLNSPIQTSRIQSKGSLSVFSTAKTPRRSCPTTIDYYNGYIGNINNNNPVSKLVTEPQISITEVQTSPQLMESEFQNWIKQEPKTPQQEEKPLAIEIEIQTTLSEMKYEDIKKSSSQTNPGGEKETVENCPEIVDKDKQNSPVPILNDRPENDSSNVPKLSTSNDSSKVPKLSTANTAINNSPASALLESDENFENLQELSTSNTTINNSPAAAILENDENSAKVLENLQELSTSNTTINNSPASAILESDENFENLQELSTSNTTINNSPAAAILENDENSPKVLENLQELSTSNTTINNSPASAILESDENFENLQELSTSNTTINNSPAPAILENDENSPKILENLQKLSTSKSNTTINSSPAAAAEFKNPFENKMNTSESPLKDIRNNKSPVVRDGPIESELSKSDQVTSELKLKDQPSPPQNENENGSYLSISHFPEESIHQMFSAAFHLSTCGVDKMIQQKQNVTLHQVEIDVNKSQTLMNKSGHNLSVICEDVNSPAHKKFRMQLSTPQKAVVVSQPKSQPDKPESESAVKVHKVSSWTNLTAEKLNFSWRNLSGVEKIEMIEKAHQNIVKLPDEEFEKLLEDSEDFSACLVSSWKKARELEDILENTPVSSEDPRIKEYFQVYTLN